MLTNERQSMILRRLEKDGSVSAASLVKQLQASSSTIRRDLEALEQKNLLKRVHGGAVKTGAGIILTEDFVETRRKRNWEEKSRIGKKAASLIQNEDFVYIDAGTTTEAMLEHIEPGSAVFVTNAVSHARSLAAKGFQVSIVGGTFKAVTEAIVGPETLTSLAAYNFTKGFFGTNGIDEKGRLTTPDSMEAATKKAAMDACRTKYILADPSKFLCTSRIVFGTCLDSTVITCRTSETDPPVPESARTVIV
ncbi:MAG: DeoR/GlpR transcriptional regulator [Erysipelotrichaceae bacterium]|nr:DeoR/GlpR transcriptional regulator [Erysipelotrichaceae bacterium]